MVDFFKAGLFLLLFLPLPLWAQVNLETFGKSRIQHKDLEWRYYSSENFDIYFYDGGETIVREAADFLEEEYNNITEFIGYSPYAKSKIFVYNSSTDLLQSNSGLHEPMIDIGGQTNFFKLQVEVAYPGTRSEFKKLLTFKVAEMLINDMMYGGSLTDMFQSSYLLTLPDWFVTGAAAYIAYGWSADMDDHVRNILLNDNVKRINRMATDRAQLTGQSIWNFMVENYGRSSVSNVLNLTRIIRNEEKSIAGTLAITYKQFMIDWRTYYVDMATRIAKNYQSPDKETRIISKNKKAIEFNKLRFSPDGTKLAYTENNVGRYKVKIYDLNTQKEKTLFKKGYKTINQEADQQLPLIDWKDDNTVGIIAADNGRYTLWLYELSSNSRIPKDLGRFNQVKDLDFSKESNLATISADINGQSDIYIISIKSNGVKRITNDPYDDINPQFLPGSKVLVFSSNRSSDALAYKVKTLPIETVPENFNLYAYHIDTTKERLARLTFTYGKDKDPRSYRDGIVFLSDQKGIDNVFKYSLSDSLITQISNFNTSILQFDINPVTDKMAFVAYDDARQFINIVDFNFSRNQFTFPTGRQETLNARKLSRRFNTKNVQDKTSSQILPDSIRVVMPSDSALVKANNAVDGINPTSLIDTENYVFDSDLIKSHQKKSILANYLKLQKESKMLGPLPYEPRFTADNMVTSFVIDPLLGFGIQLEVQMKDMLEDNRFSGGVISTTDFRSGRVFGEYQYLKKKLDYHIRFERDAIESNPAWAETPNDYVVKKYALNKVEAGISLPISATSRFRFSGLGITQSMNDISREIWLNPLINTDSFYASHKYAGIRAEWIFDNTTRYGINVLSGTKAKVSLENINGLDDARRSFNKFYIDIRHYQKIHREFVWATRAYYGNFFGASPQYFMLGGMENWILSSTNWESYPNRPTMGRDDSNILFNEYVTNLRGFDYNKFMGREVFVLNSELRLPIFRYLYRDYISSNFFRNFQVVTFFDFGSSWTGVWPFNENNSISTVHQPAGPNFDVVLKNYKNPWLSSYGLGLRTVVFGYYLKMDMAYPIEDYEVANNPSFYFTFGFDF